jgi:hypothetical protein
MATVDETTPMRGIALLIVATFFIGYCDGPATVIATIEINDQNDIGAAGGFTGALRSIFGGVFAAIYVAVLTNRAEETVPEQVPKALIEAGLPASSVAPFLEAISSGTAAAFEAVKGLTPKIEMIGIAAYKHAYADAIKTVFLISIVAGGLGFIATLFTGRTEDRLNDQVTAILHGTAAEDIRRGKEEVQMESA